MKTDAVAGSFATGKWADFVVLRDRSDDPVSALRMEKAETLEQRLFAYQFFAPDVETWTRGVRRV